MKKLFKMITITLVIILISASSYTAQAYVPVKGHYKKNGTYVAPYVRSNPNGLKYDNYGYKPSQGLYNSTYGTRGSSWDTPTYITDPYYYVGKSLYESKSTTLYPSLYTPTNTTPKVNTSYTTTYSPSVYMAPTLGTAVSSTYKTAVTVPANAYEFASDWYCNEDYKTTYDSSMNKVGCEKIISPDNSHINRGDWHCNPDYETVYDRNVKKVGCKKRVIPENATVFGAGWYCNMGYVNVYDKSYNKIGCELKK